MRNFLYTFLLFSLSLGALRAQIIELPLQNNPHLQQHNAIERQLSLEFDEQEAQRVLDTRAESVATFRGDNDRTDTTYLFSGDTIKFCTDNLGLKNEFKLVSKTTNFGTFVPSDTANRCWFYQSFKNITLGIDTFRLTRTTLNGTIDTFSRILIVRRKTNIVTLPLTTLKANEEAIVCVPVKKNLPGTWRSTTLLNTVEIATELHKYSSWVDSCIYFKAARQRGTRTVRYLVCDNYKICTEFNLPFEVQNDVIDLNKEYFMDDFSYEGPYPNARFWVNDDVLVNTSMAYNPPSIGVATFDGINKEGNPHGGAYGISDRLTSAVMDFTNVADTLQYLSFYLEPKGAGYPPKLEDKFYVQFRDTKGIWSTRAIYNGLPNNFLPSDSTVESSTFTYYKLRIPTSFQGNAFQFRFYNIGNRTGFTQLWHLDYVRVGNDNETNIIFRDLAFTSLPTHLLKDYTAMPWKHFQGKEDELLNFTAGYKIDNLHSEALNYNNTTIKIETLESKEVIVMAGLDKNTINNQSFAQVNEPLDSLPRYLLRTNMKKFVPTSKATFVTKYIGELDGNQYKKFKSVFQNDTIRSTTVFDNYFSYDDGIAEGAIAAKGNGTQVAVKYTTTIDDSLQAIQLYFPQIKEDVSSQQFNLLVWIKDLKDTANYILEKRRPVYASKVTKTPGGFTTYPLMDENNKPKALYIPKGKFYIGWEQVTSSADGIPVGIDKSGRSLRQPDANFDPNNPNAPLWELQTDKLTTVFQNFDGNWQRGPKSLKGVIMIHPVMSGGSPIENTTVLATPEVPLEQLVRIAPNPASDYLNIALQGSTDYADLTFVLYNSLGQTLQSGNLEAQLPLNHYENGIYFLNLKNKKTNQQFSHKFVVIK